MLFDNIVLPSVVIPMIAALVALVLCGLLRRWQQRRASGSVVRPQGGAAALALAFASALVAMNGWPRMPPVEATQRLFVFVLLALALSYFVRKLSDGKQLATTFVLALPVLAFLLESQIEHRWSTLASVIWILSLAAVGVLLAWGWSTSIVRASVETAPKGSDPLWAAAIRPTLLGLAALCLGLSGSALLGQLMGALAAATATVEAWQLLKKEQVWLKADALVWTVASGGLIANTFFYAELAPIPAALLVLGFTLLARNRSGAPALFRLACLLPILVAAGLVIQGELQQARGGDDYYDYGALETPQAAPFESTVRS